VHKAREFQDAEMFGNRGLRNFRMLGQHPNGLLAPAAEPLENRTPRRIGERDEQIIRGSGHSNP
jgi:hypothetical protein